MFSPMTLGLRVDGRPEDGGRLDATALRALLVAVLAHGPEALVAVDAWDATVFVCPRAAKLLERVGGTAAGLPDAVREVVREWRDAGTSTLSRRLVVPASTRALHARIAATRVVPGVEALVWIREEVRRDDRLYTALRERYALSRRAFQLALLVRQGLTNREIARELRLSEATVKIYLHHLYRTCGVRSRTTLLAVLRRLEEER